MMAGTVSSGSAGDDRSADGFEGDRSGPLAEQ